MRLSAARKATPERNIVGLHALWEQASRVRGRSSIGTSFHHLRQAFRGIATAPVGAALTLVSIAFALSLFGFYLLLLENTRGALSQQRALVTMSVFLDEDLTPGAVEALRADVRGVAGVDKVDFVSSQDALERLKGSLGDEADVLQGIEGRNPLPASLEITFIKARGAVDDQTVLMERLAARLSEKQGVQKVLFDKGFVAEISDLLASVTRIGLMGVGILFVVVAFIIGSTVRLALHAHRDEIHIMRLIGARDNFIRAPFLIEGGIQGLLGGALALGLVYGVFRLGAAAMLSAGSFPLLGGPMAFLSVWSMALVVVAGLAVGLGASAITLRRFSVDG